MDYTQQYKIWTEKADKAYLKELKALSGDDKELKERFSMPLAFGTAGMRGVLGMGIGNMNVYTVARATKGLAEYIKSEEAQKRGVIISYDTRRMSYEFALVTARVLAAQGVTAYLFEDVRPVPMCSFAVRHLGCKAGVMITASHNPKEYNGYKVYGEDGAQMSPEATAKVVKYIDESDYFDIPMADVVTDERDIIKGKDNYCLSDNITVIGSSVDNRYFDEVAKLSLSQDEVAAVGKDIKIVYSPLHGSGYMPVTTMLKRMGISADIVEEQRLPDPDFPTVTVPNPEQPEALALGISLANKTGSDLVIGTDPDCDRMGIAVRDDQGQFVTLTGNQIGCLLMDYVLSRRADLGAMPDNAAVVKTIVTTRLANRIADAYGAKVYDVLTGFKFIGEKIKQWEENQHRTFMFGFEESYGYLCGTHARDKDAVVASMLIAELACYCLAHGVTLYDRLRGIWAKYGYFCETSKSLVFKGLDGMERMSGIMEKLRACPPKSLGGKSVSAVSDYLSSVTEYSDGKQQLINLPKANVLKYELGGDMWACVRPSGTEPKLKIYVSTAGDDKVKTEELNKLIQSELSACAD
ncbi:MAG: phospho-sugar mutase [Clostridia bacterium]|nr:phospho-sugar mutase [Clostridia bacterium]